MTPVPISASITTSPLRGSISAESLTWVMRIVSLIPLSACQFTLVSWEPMFLGWPRRMTLGVYPAPARCRAATNPSPPFPPGPQTMTTLDFLPKRSMTAAATALPAFSMSWSLETPRYSEFISTALISRAVSVSSRSIAFLASHKVT